MRGRSDILTAGACAVAVLTGIQPAHAQAPQTPGPERAVAPSAPASDDGFAVGGMVGQVNGRAIYANDVLDPIEDQLVALGRRLGPMEFRREASGEIVNRLRVIITEELLYSEAQRALSDREKAGLDHMMVGQRQELLRRYGRGSAALAEERVLELEEKSLDEVLEDIRKKIVVEHLLRQKLLSRINVTSRDIERHYRENREKFNPPATREIRVIRVATADDAERVEQRLAAGEPFESVARSDLNGWKRETGGRMDAAAGDEVFREPSLNEAMLGLGEGGHTGDAVCVRESFWFLCVEGIDRPPSRSLDDVQLEIVRELKEKQFRSLDEQYRRQLFASGSYDQLNEMALTLVRIAINRHGPGPPEAGGRPAAGVQGLGSRVQSPVSRVDR